MKIKAHFTVANNRKLAERHFCSSLNCFISLTVTYSSTIHIEITVAVVP